MLDLLRDPAAESVLALAAPTITLLGFGLSYYLHRKELENVTNAVVGAVAGMLAGWIIGGSLGLLAIISFEIVNATSPAEHNNLVLAIGALNSVTGMIGGAIGGYKGAKFDRIFVMTWAGALLGFCMGLLVALVMLLTYFIPPQKEVAELLSDILLLMVGLVISLTPLGAALDE